MHSDPTETPKPLDDRPSKGRVPVIAGIPVGPALTGILYVLLVLAAGVALLGHRLGEGAAGGTLVRLAPWLFLAFLVCFAGYRLILVRARKYPVFKAFFQIAVGTAVFALLMPRAQKIKPPTDPMMVLLRDEDPHVRALASEVVGFRGDARYGKELVHRLQDGAVEVREKAHESLVKLNGTDLGDPENDGAVEAWRERYP